MIYVDSSVALAHLLGEDRSPPETLWREHVISSRLLEYEVWNRIHAYDLSRSHDHEVRALLAGFILIDLSPQILSRALRPFPSPIRTLDALHLATIEFLRSREPDVEFATYDRQLVMGAQALGIPMRIL